MNNETETSKPADLPIQRYFPTNWVPMIEGNPPYNSGDWVKYTDHVAEVERLTKERDNAYSAIEHDRSIVADGVTAMKKVLDGRHWLTEGRGSYEWDDDRWQSEFKAAGLEMIAAMEPLKKLAADLSNSPKDAKAVIEARRARAELAESRLSRLQTIIIFFASVIKSGEKWSKTCEEFLNEALGK